MLSHRCATLEAFVQEPGESLPNPMLRGQSHIALHRNYAIVVDDSLQYTWNQYD